jgi:hypothetical protein
MIELPVQDFDSQSKHQFWMPSLISRLCHSLDNICLSIGASPPTSWMQPSSNQKMDTWTFMPTDGKAKERQIRK